MELSTLSTLKDTYPTSSWALWSDTFPEEGCLEEDPGAFYEFLKDNRDRHPFAVQAHAPAAPALVDADEFQLLNEVDRTGRRLRAVVGKLAGLAHGKLPARIAPMARSIDSAHARYALYIQHGC